MAHRIARYLRHLQTKAVNYHQLSSADVKNTVILAKNTNQALGIAKFAIDFLNGKLGTGPDPAVLRRVELFHTDSVICGISAIALRTNAPTILREEALHYSSKVGATVFGSAQKVFPEKAVVANSSAVREWDSNGTVFGYNKKLNHLAGEFGHNDFYPVVIAGCELRGYDGLKALHGMILLDEIRGRLAEVFALNKYKVDHVVHGAIASAAVYGALLGATPEQIESAIGMVVAHYIPFRAIRAGHQLSDSKGASAAISTEAAILSVHRSMNGFVGPKDIFRNPLSIFRLFEPTSGDSPFNLVLTHSGQDFAVMGMHFKLGLYEHQSAGSLQGLINLIQKNPQLLQADSVKKIKIVAYQPAFGIIGDPHKRHPDTRQSADHSMVYIVARKLRNAIELHQKQQLGVAAGQKANDALWKQLILTPVDYSTSQLYDKVTRSLMEKIEFEHGGKTYDDLYPDGIPTSIVITDKQGRTYDSGLVMYPAGHARNSVADLEDLLLNKFRRLGALAVEPTQLDPLLQSLQNLAQKSPSQLAKLYSDIPIRFANTKEY